MGRTAKQTCGTESRLDFPAGTSLRQIIAQVHAKLNELNDARLLFVSSEALEAAADDLEDARLPRLPQHDQTRASVRAERIAERLRCVYGYRPQSDCYWFRRERQDRQN